jgi:signal transduction histidine kinase
MTLFEIGFYIFVVLLNIGLAFFVFLTKKTSEAKSFVLLLFYSTAWILSVFFFFYSSNSIVVFWIGKFSFAAVLLMLFALLNFVRNFSKKIDEKENKKEYFIIRWMTYFIAGITLFTNLVIENEIIIGVAERETVYGSFYSVWIIYFLFLFAVSIFNLVKKYKKSEGGLEKKQVTYILIGSFIAISVGFFMIVVLTLFNIKSAEAYGGPFALLIFFVFTTYVILKYRLMDIRVALSRGLVYVLSFFSVISIGIFVIFAIETIFLNVSQKVLISLSLIIGISLFKPIFEFFQNLASKYFNYTFYNYQRVLADLGKSLTRVLDIEKLSSLINDTLADTMKLNRAVILIRSEKEGRYIIQKNIGFKEENGISLVKDNFLTEYLEKKQKPLVYEELSLILRDSQSEEEKNKIKELQKNMHRIEAALCLPLLIEDKISGMIVLGNKISGDPYFEQDIDLLSGLSSQASIAFQNAKLYSEVQDLSQNLEKKVDEQVKELKQAYEKLQKLDKVKTEFMSIISHQLRTPLSIVKGHLSMINEGVYDDDEKRKKEILNNVYEANERLIALVNDVLNISRIQSGRVEINKEKVNLVELTRRTTERMMPSADEKGIKLIFHKNKKELPEIKIDVAKIENVIINLVDNAIKYTNEGQVEVFVKEEEKHLLIEIKDTGEGMAKDELEKLFDTFSRGDAGKKNWIQGAGLGLYIARQFVEMHNGKVWAESEGEGKGSQFCIKLPL